MEPEPAAVIVTAVAEAMVEEVTAESKAAVTVNDAAGSSSSAGLTLFTVKMICDSGSSMGKSAGFTVYPVAVPVKRMNSTPSAMVSELRVRVISAEPLRALAAMVTVAVAAELV